LKPLSSNKIPPSRAVITDRQGSLIALTLSWVPDGFSTDKAFQAKLPNSAFETIILFKQADGYSLPDPQIYRTLFPRNLKFKFRLQPFLFEGFFFFVILAGLPPASDRPCRFSRPRRVSTTKKLLAMKTESVARNCPVGCCLP
jgi:hypothetical protein